MILKTYELRCDVPGCTHVGRTYVTARAGGSGNASSSVRSANRSNGWRRIAKRDYCPQHVETGRANAKDAGDG